MFAGPGEQEGRLAAPGIAALPGAINFAGALSLPEVSACLKRCALFIGNDSGLMHLAAAAGTPVLIDPEMARTTASQVGSHLAGWFSFQPLFDRIVREQPDLLD